MIIAIYTITVLPKSNVEDDNGMLEIKITVQCGSTCRANILDGAHRMRHKMV